MDKPKLISTKTVYQCPYYEVREDLLDHGDGVERVYSNIKVVENGGVSIVALDKDENIYMLNEYRYPVDKTLLALPAGGVDRDETALEAAKKELAEEAGLRARLWKSLGTFYSSPGSMDDRATIYLARELSELERHIEAHELIEVVKLPFEEAIEKVYSGEIIDAWAIIPILMAKKYLEANHK